MHPPSELSSLSYCWDAPLRQIVLSSRQIRPNRGMNHEKARCCSELFGSDAALALDARSVLYAGHLFTEIPRSDDPSILVSIIPAAFEQLRPSVRSALALFMEFASD